jgi:hypothetical protein
VQVFLLQSEWYISVVIYSQQQWGTGHHFFFLEREGSLTQFLKPKLMIVFTKHRRINAMHHPVDPIDLLVSGHVRLLFRPVAHATSPLYPQEGRARCLGL